MMRDGRFVPQKVVLEFSGPQEAGLAPWYTRHGDDGGERDQVWRDGTETWKEYEKARQARVLREWPACSIHGPAQIVWVAVKGRPAQLRSTWSAEYQCRGCGIDVWPGKSRGPTIGIAEAYRSLFGQFKLDEPIDQLALKADRLAVECSAAGLLAEARTAERISSRLRAPGIYDASNEPAVRLWSRRLDKIEKNLVGRGAPTKDGDEQRKLNALRERGQQSLGDVLAEVRHPALKE